MVNKSNTKLLVTTKRVRKIYVKWNYWTIQQQNYNYD